MSDEASGTSAAALDSKDGQPVRTPHQSMRSSSAFPDLIRIRNVGETERLLTPPSQNGKSKKISSSSPALSISGSQPSNSNLPDLAKASQASAATVENMLAENADSPVITPGASSSKLLVDDNPPAGQESAGGDASPAPPASTTGECAADVGQDAPTQEPASVGRSKSAGPVVEIFVPTKRKLEQMASTSSAPVAATSLIQRYLLDYVDVPILTWARKHINSLIQGDETEQKKGRRRSSGSKSVRWAASSTDAPRTSGRVRTPAASKDPWANTPEPTKVTRTKSKKGAALSSSPEASSSSRGASGSSKRRRLNKSPADGSELPAEYPDDYVNMTVSDEVDFDPLPSPSTSYVYPLTQRFMDSNAQPFVLPSFLSLLPPAPLQGPSGPILPPVFHVAPPAPGPSTSDSLLAPTLLFPSMPPEGHALPSFSIPALPLGRFLPFEAPPSALMHMLLPPQLRPDQSMYQVLTQTLSSQPSQDPETSTAQSALHASSGIPVDPNGAPTPNAERSEKPELPSKGQEDIEMVDNVDEATSPIQAPHHDANPAALVAHSPPLGAEPGASQASFADGAMQQQNMPLDASEDTTTRSGTLAGVISASSLEAVSELDQPTSIEERNEVEITQIDGTVHSALPSDNVVNVNVNETNSDGKYTERPIVVEGNLLEHIQRTVAEETPRNGKVDSEPASSIGAQADIPPNHLPGQSTGDTMATSSLRVTPDPAVVEEAGSAANSAASDMNRDARFRQANEGLDLPPSSHVDNIPAVSGAPAVEVPHYHFPDPHTFYLSEGAAIATPSLLETFNSAVLHHSESESTTNGAVGDMIGNEKIDHEKGNLELPSNGDLDSVAHSIVAPADVPSYHMPEEHSLYEGAMMTTLSLPETFDRSVFQGPDYATNGDVADVNNNGFNQESSDLNWPVNDASVHVPVGTVDFSEAVPPFFSFGPMEGGDSTETAIHQLMNDPTVMEDSMEESG